MENKNSWTMAWFTDKGWTDRWERLSSPKEVESQLRYIEDDPYACSLKNVKIIPPEADIYSMDPGEFFKHIEKGTIDAGPVMIVSKNRGADVYTSYETVDGTVKAAHRLVDMVTARNSYTDEPEYWDIRVYLKQALEKTMTGIDFRKKYAASLE